MPGIIEGKDQKSLAVNGMPDHVHVFGKIKKPDMRIPELIRDVKNNLTGLLMTKEF